jgi:hypothetical protein
MCPFQKVAIWKTNQNPEFVLFITTCMEARFSKIGSTGRSFEKRDYRLSL